MKKIKSTIWLDFLTIVLIPFYILTSTLTISKLLMHKIDILNLILTIIIFLFSVVTFLFAFKRKKPAYYLLMVYVLLIMSYEIYRNAPNLMVMVIAFVVGILVWFIPNLIYLYRHKDCFYEHNMAHIKKCPGCNRIIPISMKCCGKCNYKE